MKLRRILACILLATVLPVLTPTQFDLVLKFFRGGIR